MCGFDEILKPYPHPYPPWVSTHWCGYGLWCGFTFPDPYPYPWPTWVTHTHTGLYSPLTAMPFWKISWRAAVIRRCLSSSSTLIFLMCHLISRTMPIFGRLAFFTRQWGQGQAPKNLIPASRILYRVIMISTNLVFIQCDNLLLRVISWVAKETREHAAHYPICTTYHDAILVCMHELFIK